MGGSTIGNPAVLSFAIMKACYLTFENCMACIFYDYILFRLIQHFEHVSNIILDVTESGFIYIIVY